MSYTEQEKIHSRKKKNMLNNRRTDKDGNLK